MFSVQLQGNQEPSAAATSLISLFDSDTDSHPCYGVPFANSNACTLSLVQFDDPAGNKLVLEGYWELRGDILTRGRGRCVAKALQRGLESVT